MSSSRQRKKEEQDYVDMAVEAVDFIKKEKRPGDILFLCRPNRISWKPVTVSSGRHYQESTILPLYVRLPAHRQRQIYSLEQGENSRGHKCGAETSLTIPGIRYVVDTGWPVCRNDQPSSIQ